MVKKVSKTNLLILIGLIALLIYTRFVGLDWGLPYPMHPDERNIAVAILDLRCNDLTSLTCLHPHFFAYGQLSIYLGSALAHLVAFISVHSWNIRFEDATLALRIISASASVITAFFMVKTITVIYEKIRKSLLYLLTLIIIFMPGFIQFSHFGTTESLLMMFYAMLLYFAARFLKYGISLQAFVTVSGVVLGMALGTKVSALAFAAVPILALAFKVFEGMQLRPFIRVIFGGIQLIAIVILFFIITSPYNLIGWSDFMGSMNYESSVGLGTFRAFYTRQFEYSLPFVFQIIRVFPYTFGGPLFLISVLAFVFLPFNKVFNFLRIQIIIFLFPTTIIYAKWARFVSPIFPAVTLMGILYLAHILQKPLDKRTQYITTALCTIIVLIICLPGMAYLTIYTKPDVRFTASKWIYKNLPNDAYILSETANVVDTPIPSRLLKPEEYQGKFYNYISFNHYDLDQESPLQLSFQDHIQKAEYIFVPSRRVFYNHTCYRNIKGAIQKVDKVMGYEPEVCEKYSNRYPLLNNYYNELFSGKLGFTQVAEFKSYPRIELFGKTILEFPDENAEETWTVFDHPVIRIYKKST